MIVLIGTGHVFDLSNALRARFDQIEPDLICVELDKQRYQALLYDRNQQGKNYRNRGKTPVIYNLLVKFQQNIAKQYGVKAGDEMLTAIRYAQSNNIPVELIDLNAREIFTKMLKSMSFTEKFKLLFSGFAGIFVNRGIVEKELENIEENFDNYLNQISKKFPSIKKTLIDDRNVHMFDRLLKLNGKYERIVACIGDGHVYGISNLLKSKNVEYKTIRLSELKQTKVSESSASFTVEYEEL
ncbi:MAG: TraB/GumN family protein [Candidatus Thermoplasmatota archaeon]|nr:TraB/GumN family protein [Candidatus Thermoplasmatota archaeon]